MSKTLKKKLAFFLSSFRAGGGEKQMIEIANAFAARGHSVDLLVLKPVGQYADRVDDRVRAISLDAGRMILSLPKLTRYLRAECPGAMLTLDEYTHLLALAARALSCSQTRVVLRIGNMLSILEDHYAGKAKILPFFVKHFFKRADAIVANSKGVADDVVAVTHIDPTKVVVIMNPKPRDEILAKAKEPLEHTWLMPKIGPVIVSVGRLRVQKNFPLLIRAFAKLPADLGARLIIVGGGREEKRLRTLVDELGLSDKISFTGYTDNPYSYMALADCLVATSLWEGMPNTLLEALACGAPIIAADCPSGPRELLAPNTPYCAHLAHGVEYAPYGVLTAVNDESALVEAMECTLRDAALRAQYAAQSSKRSQELADVDTISEYAHVLAV